MSRSDLVLLRRAVREHWPADEAKRPAIVDRAFHTLECGDTRRVIAAARTLLEMDKANVGAAG